MSDFHDPELRQELGRLSGPYPDNNVAFAQWRRRVGQVRRRRAIAWTSGAAMSLVFATVGAAALQSQRHDTTRPSDSVESSVETTVKRTTTTQTKESSTTTSTTLSPTTTAAPVDTTPTTTIAIDTTAPEPESTEAASGGAGPSSSGKSGKTGTTAAPPAPAPQNTQSFSSDGGSITVRQDGDKLTIIAVNPTAGFKVDEGDSSGRKVSVSFKSDKHSSHISVKISEGAMKPSVSEKDESQGESDHSDPPETDNHD
jgi:hypothetical protein